MVSSVELPEQKICIVKTFIDRPEESDEEIDSADPVVRSCTEPMPSNRSSEVELEEPQADDHFRRLPEQKIRVVNTFIDQLDESDDEGSPCNLVGKSQTEPATATRKTVRFSDAADSIDEDENFDEVPVTSLKTFDPFDSDLSILPCELPVPSEFPSRHILDDDDAEDSDLAVTRVKTFDGFDTSCSSPVVRPGLAMPQPVMMFPMTALPVMMLAPVGPCTSPPAAAGPPAAASPPLAGRPEEAPAAAAPAVAEEKAEALPCLLGATKLPEAELQKSSSPGLQMETLPGGCAVLHWTIEGRKVSSQEKQLLSPEFDIHFPDQGLVPFRLIVAAKQMTRHKGGQTFAKAQGRARISIRCGDSMREGASSVAFRLRVGTESRGPFWHQFVEKNCCDLQECCEDWDLVAAAKSSKHLEVCLEVVGFRK
eukprot:gb/GFBE01004478.1/.p1 GENE.gb/GFBE01004478.1/~~gb/GFBE01004478.1/.p1  ORF type:complete len:425 (+),score=111.33 gb/GFBE01004478.1/:1-1275(+)